MTEPIRPRSVATTGRVDPSPLPQMTRSIAVGISLRCLPRRVPSGPNISAVQYRVPPSRSTTPTTRWTAWSLADRADGLGGLSGHFDGALEEAAELLTPLGGPQADADAEVVPLGIPGDERLGEDDEFGPPSGPHPP